MKSPYRRSPAGARGTRWPRPPRWRWCEGSSRIREPGARRPGRGSRPARCARPVRQSRRVRPRCNRGCAASSPRRLPDTTRCESCWSSEEPLLHPSGGLRWLLGVTSPPSRPCATCRGSDDYCVIGQLPLNAILSWVSVKLGMSAIRRGKRRERAPSRVAVVGAASATAPTDERFSVRAHIPALKALPGHYELVAACTTRRRARLQPRSDRDSARVRRRRAHAARSCRRSTSCACACRTRTTAS